MGREGRSTVETFGGIGMRLIRGRGRGRYAIIALAAVVAMVAATVGVLVSMFVLTDPPGARSMEDAIAAFRADASSVEVVTVRRPPTGVYTAAGSGRASISFPPVSQSYGDVVPITLRTLDANCWSMTADFNEAFSQTWNYCLQDGRLIERSNTALTRWDLGVTTIDNRTEFTCDPPGVLIAESEAEGTVSTFQCAGVNDQISGPTTSDSRFEFVGAELLTIGIDEILTWRYRETQTMSGGQRGTVVQEFWFSIADFLPVRMQRDFELQSDSPVGTVTYQETGEWQLSSMNPNR